MRWPNEALLYTLTEYQLLDSMAVEAGGNICVATILNGGITVISPHGELVEFVKLAADPIVTNLAFGGADMRTAYICAAGSGLLYQTEWRRPGLGLYSRSGEVP
jgi:gluconolactonase